MILYITRKFPPSIGGMQRFNAKLSSNLQSLTKVHLIAWGGSQAFLPVFLPCAFLRALLVSWTSPVRVIYVSDGLLAPLGLLLKCLTGKPVIANIHGRDIAFSLKVYQLVVPWCLRHLDQVICVSHALKEECIKRGVAAKKLEVIPNGINVQDFVIKGAWDREGEYLQLTGQPRNGRKVLLTVGRLVAKKGVLHFLENILPEIIKKKPEIVYLIVGSGPLKDTVALAIREKHLQKNAILVGDVAMSGDSLARVYKLSDLFVMPNIPVAGDMEGFGIVALEAAAAGIPVVASKVDGITEAVHNGHNGLLIPHDDTGNFARIVLDILDNPEHRDFGKQAKDYVAEHFSWDTIARQYLAVFNRVSGKE